MVASVFWISRILLSTTVLSDLVAGGSFGADSGQNSSFLWAIETEPPSYLFGTIHVPYTSVWDAIPNNTKKAFTLAKNVYVELDMTRPATMSALSDCQLLPKGRHLSEMLPFELFLNLRMHLDYVRKAMKAWVTNDQKIRGITAENLYATLTANWERKQPIWIVILLNSLTKGDVAVRGGGHPVLDVHLTQLAKRFHKNIGAIEAVQEQCEPLNRLNESQVIFALNQTLRHLEDVKLGQAEPRFTTDDLVQLYRTGNLDPAFFKDNPMLPGLGETSSTSSSAIDSKMTAEIDGYFKEHMIVRRNQVMAQRVMEIVNVTNKGESSFFALGAGHLMGSSNVVNLLKAAGFSVRHLSPYDQIKTYNVETGSNTVQGTFDDLSVEEKTKVFLQLMQYREKQDQKKVQRLMNLSEGPWSGTGETAFGSNLGLMPPPSSFDASSSSSSYPSSSSTPLSSPLSNLQLLWGLLTCAIFFSLISSLNGLTFSVLQTN